MRQTKDPLIGRRVVALKADMDHDEEDRERQIPVGTHGVIERLNYVDFAGVRHCDVMWANGGWTVYSELEVATDLRLEA